MADTSAIAAKKLWVRLALCTMFKSLLLRKYAAADLRIDGPQRVKPSAFKNAAVAKLARRGRLKICYIRNVVGSNPTCGTILFQFSLWKLNGRPLAQGESRRFDRLETTLWLSIAAGQQLAGDGPLSEVNSIVGM